MHEVIFKRMDTLFKVANYMILLGVDQLKVLRTVVCTATIQMVYVFMPDQRTTKLFSHYKAVLKNISLFISHASKKAIWSNPGVDVAIRPFHFASLPMIIQRADFQTLPFIQTRFAQACEIRTFAHRIPKGWSLLTASACNIDNISPITETPCRMMDHCSSIEVDITQSPGLVQNGLFYLLLSLFSASLSLRPAHNNPPYSLMAAPL